MEFVGPEGVTKCDKDIEISCLEAQTEGLTIARTSIYTLQSTFHWSKIHETALVTLSPDSIDPRVRWRKLAMVKNVEWIVFMPFSDSTIGECTTNN